MDVIINLLGGVLTITFLLVTILLLVVFGVGMVIALISFFKHIIDDIKSEVESGETDADSN